jgi:hypothetical protein
MRVSLSIWERILEQAHSKGTFDFCGKEVTRIAVFLALDHVGLWLGDDAEWR